MLSILIDLSQYTCSQCSYCKAHTFYDLRQGPFCNGNMAEKLTTPLVSGAHLNPVDHNWESQRERPEIVHPCDTIHTIHHINADVALVQYGFIGDLDIDGAPAPFPTKITSCDLQLCSLRCAFSSKPCKQCGMS